MSVSRTLLAALCGPALLAIIPHAGAAPATAVPINGERRLNFDADWRFNLGEAAGAEQNSFDDSKWTTLRLPHDWAIDGPFDPKLNPHEGALKSFGTGWYRKWFTLPEGAKGKRVWIEFDGAMANSTVWINGHELGHRPYGYISFAYDMTPYLNYGAKENVVAVELAPEENSSRWYAGAGIYRNVWLTVTAPVRVAHWGTFVTTPEITDEKASVSVKTEIANQSGQEARVTLQTSVVDAAGKAVTKTANDATIAANGSETVSATLSVPRPQRWDIDHPYLYTVVSEVMDGKRVVDRYTTPLGIRTVQFDPQKGFLLNGKHRKIQGVCDHHDLGALGAAVNRRATERQLQILRGAGVNAIRTSHNPPSPELLELCDRMGFVVMDESFDMWKIPKKVNGYAKYFDEWSERDVRDFVHRDRNHPSVIMWSIGNEIPEQGRPQGGEMAKRLTGLFHEEDPTRPTTSAFNNPDNAVKNHLGENVDLFGVNYRPWQYEQFMKEHPTWKVFGSETSSCVSSRGTYQLPIVKYDKDPSHQLSSYDIIAPPWAYCPDVDFFYEDKFPQVLGEFVWTGFDYIGEPTPYFNGRAGDRETDWPARSSYFGFIDLAGFPKDRYYLYQSQWSDKPMVHVLPHWNWRGMEGKPLPVMAYSNADEVELFLNGKSLGKKKRFAETWEMPVGANVSKDKKFETKYRRVWQVPYEPGTLKAVAYNGSKQVAVDEVHTAGEPARIKLVADRSTIAADNDDLSFVTVRIEDKDGNLCPVADNEVKFTVEGAGKIQAVDNGNAATTEPFHANQRKVFNGLALLIVRAGGTAGKIHVTAAGAGLQQAALDLTAKKAL
ncbi:MAG TPA: beta-galactosidase GalB [Bryobacteraceae bacterium]|nr:beta-galactosidase GalB [Bryobacteraceae bacterium]